MQRKKLTFSILCAVYTHYYKGPFYFTLSWALTEEINDQIQRDWKFRTMIKINKKIKLQHTKVFIGLLRLNVLKLCSQTLVKHTYIFSYSGVSVYVCIHRVPGVSRAPVSFKQRNKNFTQFNDLQFPSLVTLLCEGAMSSTLL